MKKLQRNLVFGGANVDGARGKWGTIIKAIIDSKSDIWMMQETKCGPGDMKKIDGFVSYEHHRTDRGGGGLAISAKRDLNPALVRDGGEQVEALTIDIHVKNMAISKKIEFWSFLEEEAVRARGEGKGFLLQGDLNCWLGPEILPGDIRKQNNNGRLFAQFVEKNNLTIVNSLPLCKGLITRSRIQQGQLIQSTIDFYVVCQRVLPFLSEMLIDIDKKYRLTNYTNMLENGTIVEADHKPMILKVNLSIIPEKPERKEILDFKNKDGLSKFKINTSKAGCFSKCFY